MTHRGEQVKARLDQRRSLSPVPPPASHTLPSRSVPQSTKAHGLATALAGESGRQCVDVGRTVAPLVSGRRALIRTGEVRHAESWSIAEISGIEYQQGTLEGYEIREYLLEKFGRKCAYCDATNVRLQVEHIVPKVRHGSSRVSNLTIACQPCNDAKGTRTAEEFGHPDIQAQAKQPLRDAAAVNATRWALYHRLAALGLPLETGTGGRTKWNRTTRELPKTHWTDAACVGASTPQLLKTAGVVPLLIAAMGRHSRQMCRTNAAAFPTRVPRRPAW